MKNKKLLLISVVLFLFNIQSQAQEFTFNPKLLLGKTKNVNISLFDADGELPGNYTVDVMLNGKQVDANKKINFKNYKDKNGKPVLKPCLSAKTLAGYGVKISQKTINNTRGECFRLSTIPGASASFDFNDFSLDLTVPQSFIIPQLNGVAPMELWDNGIPAIFVNYDANSQYSNFGNQSRKSFWLQLFPGLNIGPWRARGSVSWSMPSVGEGHWTKGNVSVQRGIESIKSSLLLGEGYSDAAIFDSVPFLGVDLQSDTAMVPSSVSRFSPVVRGVARTQARVEIKQNGHIIYNKILPPGPFILSHLNVLSSQGDLHVTIWDTDGAPQHFTVPYSTPAISLSKGYLKYNFMIGKYNAATQYSQKKPTIFQITAMYGLPADLTVYGGFQGMKRYLAYSVGVGASLGDFGALSVDMTQSDDRIKKARGGMVRVRYNKEINQTNTSFSITYNDYTNDAYRTMNNVLNFETGKYSYFNNVNSMQLFTRHSLNLNLTQSFGQYGNLSLSGQWANYYNDDSADYSFNVSYSMMFRKLNDLDLIISFANNHYSHNITDTTASIIFSLPLENRFGQQSYLSYQNITRPGSHSSSHRLQLSGTSDDHALNWSLAYNHQINASSLSNSGSLQVNWNTRAGVIDGSYDSSPTSSDMNLGIHGSILLFHAGKRNGFTLSQPINGTSALIEAPGANNVIVQGVGAIKTDSQGDAVESYITPYQKDNIVLDDTNLTGNFDIPNSVVQVVPTEGAIVLVYFKTNIGKRALIYLTRPNGQSIPFGSLVSLSGSSDNTEVSGKNGEVYMTGLSDTGVLTVKWNTSSCKATYHLPSKETYIGIYEARAICK